VKHFPPNAAGPKLALLAVVLAATVAPPAVGAAPRANLIPGVYHQIVPATRHLLPGGSRIIIERSSTGRLEFTIDAVREAGSHTGHISGSFAGTLPVGWTHRSGSANCRLSFARSALGLVVTQDEHFGDCGFGYGVTATGTYVRVSGGTTNP
jgi:hypothetical protein